MSKFCEIEQCWLALVTYLHIAFIELVFRYTPTNNAC